MRDWRDGQLRYLVHWPVLLRLMRSLVSSSARSEIVHAVEHPVEVAKQLEQRSRKGRVRERR